MRAASNILTQIHGTDILRKIWVLFALTFPLFAIDYIRFDVSGFTLAAPALCLFTVMIAGGLWTLGGRRLLQPILLTRSERRLLAVLSCLFFAWHLLAFFKAIDTDLALGEIVKLAIGLSSFWAMLIFFPVEERFIEQFWKFAIWTSAALMALLIYKYAYVFHSIYLGNNWGENTKNGKNQLTWYLVFIVPYAFSYSFLRGKKNLIALVPLIVLGVALVYSESRGAWISVIASAITMLYFVLKQQKNNRIKWVTAVIGGVVFVAWISIRLLPSSGAKLESTIRLLELFHYNSPQNNSIRDRMSFLNDALDFFSASPVTGLGLGSFQTRMGVVTHDDYMALLVDTGPGCLLVFLLFMFVIWEKIFRRGPTLQRPSWIAMGTRGAMVGVLVSLVYINAYTTMLFWAFLGLALITIESEHRSNQTFSNAPTKHFILERSVYPRLREGSS